VALSGAIRPAGQTEARLKEAAKLGFKTAVLPPGAKADGLRLVEAATLGELVDLIRNGDL
jgi:DNA repair protein RadA/Sms